MAKNDKVKVDNAAENQEPEGGNANNGGGGRNDAIFVEMIANLRNLVAYQSTPRDSGGVGVRRTSEIEMVVSDALRDVLGKTVRRNDGRALQGVLDHVFKFETVEGHRRVRFQPPTYTVTTDFGTKLSGPQKSLYTFIESVGTELRKRIEIMRPLKIASDSERTEPDRNGWLIELEELIATVRNSLNLRPLRLDGAFSRLEKYRLNVEHSFGFRENQLDKNIQSIDDEQNYTEYLNAKLFQENMKQAWENFKRQERLINAPPFLFYSFNDTPRLIGTHLAELEDLLAVVDESVEEIYDDLEALGIGEAERRVTELDFNVAGEQKITVAELFDWARSFSKEKAQRILKDGGRSALRILNAEASQLMELVGTAKDATDLDTFHHPRLSRSIDALSRHLEAVQKHLGPPPPMGNNQEGA
jgi:hypothetical protein